MEIKKLAHEQLLKAVKNCSESAREEISKKYARLED